MSGTLFVVATPIGNLEDITLRALRVLRSVALVAAEDTRRTGNLLRHFEIATPTISLHEHNERQRTPELIRRLNAGESIALVSDAGTPGISDPGATLVRAARAAGIRIEPIPGPSAVTAALSGSGYDLGRFVFAGFPPIRSKDRKQWFAWVAEIVGAAVVLFEAPHRITLLLKDISDVFGERPILVIRELSKIHEQWLEGSASNVLASLDVIQGEFVVILAPREPEQVHEPPDDDEIGRIFGLMTKNVTSGRREAIRKTADALQVSSRAVFDALERLKKSGE